MSKLSLPLLTLLLGLFLIPIEAEAKRFGGGLSGGKSYSTPQRQAPAPAQQRQQRQDQNQQPGAAQTAGRAGMGGMLGGLLAGGLLAALFMGGAFDGIQFMDILLIALLGFAAWKLFGMFRGQAQSQQQPAYAGPAQVRTEAPRQFEPVAPVSQPEPLVTNFGSGFSDAELSLPEWFDKSAFLSGATGHFKHLQRAWDEKNWDEISTYTSPEMLAWLQSQPTETAEQFTEVVSVMAELVNFIQEDDHVVASVHFYGWLRETQDSDATEFSEVWHLNRQMGEQPGDWLIVGIEQS
ncbi:MULTISPECIES: Tim44 domain-containing protein [Nitrincola]|uniref:Tim44-like domain-containing protein n=1 Tax=Nitrincola nitratireducens TaxID=1229521 RepID=W9VQP2_9GAMM|nr:MULTISPECIES: TIM44-like domain-containing protein [Nitrincola]EXJ12765.1 hypothetical protein D791_00106 [Nitrincola nitratireducens]